MDKTYVTKIGLPDGSWIEGPKVKASTYKEAEKRAIEYAVYIYGYHRNNLHARARRLDAKSVWPGGIDKEMCR